MVGSRGRGNWLAVGLVVVVLMAGACSGTSSEAGRGDVASGSTSAATGAPTGSEVQAPGTTAPTMRTAPVPSAGCGTSTTPPGNQVEHTFTSDGVPRRYLVTTPSAHDGKTPVPLVLDFHGLMEGAEVHSGMSQYSKLAEEKGFVAVFPHGTGQPIRWDANIAHSPNPDLTYFDTMLEQLGKDLCVDESRVYATGLSYGAIFTSLLLCTRADVLAAAAPVAGIQYPEGCQPDRIVPIVTYHGTADPILLFNGGVDMTAISSSGGAASAARPPADLNGPGYPEAVASWAKHNGCQATPKDTDVSASVVHRVYDCPEGADVEFYIVKGGGHSWPGSEFSKSIEKVVGPTTFDIDATRDSWEFFSRFNNPDVAFPG